MRNIKAVIFDVGRVLVSIDGSGEKFRRLLTDLSITPDEAFQRFSFTPEVRQFMTGEIDPHHFHILACTRLGISMPYREFVECWCDLFKPEAGMALLFQEVAARYKVGILSDTDPLHWQKIKETLPWLTGVVQPTLSFEVGCLKPHPQMFLTAAANCGCEKDECLFIDDRVENVDGARFSGMPALQFTDAEKLRKDLGGLRVL